MKKYFENNKIFSARLELLSLFLPVAFLAIVLIEFATRSNILISLTNLQISLIVNIVFLNITHNAFTFINLTAPASMSSWIKGQGGKRSFWIKISGLFLFLILAFSLLLFLSEKSAVWFFVFLILNFGFGAHHALAQSFGMALAYDSSPPKSGFRTLERCLFNSFVGINLAAGALLICATSNLFISWRDLLLSYARYLIGCGFFVVMAMFLAQLLIFKDKSLNKIVFYLRFFIWPMALVSPFGIFATEAIHGIEYAQVTHKFAKKRLSSKLWLGAGIIILTILFAVLRIFTILQIATHQKVNVLFVIVTAVSLAFSFLHYYLDRLLFRMRKKLNREIVGAILYDQAD